MLNLLIPRPSATETMGRHEFKEPAAAFRHFAAIPGGF